MKNRFVFVLLIGVLLLAACTQSKPATSGQELKITDSTTSKTYTVDDLKKLPSAKASFKGVEYVGVPLVELLKNAGFDPTLGKAVKVIASDGFTVNYEPALFTKADTLVAYATSDGPLTSDDGTFRMVLPDQEGKLNVRMIVEIQLVK